MFPERAVSLWLHAIRRSWSPGLPVRFLVLLCSVTLASLSLSVSAGGATTSKLTMKGLKARANGHYADAHLYLEQACDNGDPAGCFVKGVMLLEGSGQSIDKSGARVLFQQACDGKNAAGCTNLALMMVNGDGGAVNIARAQKLYAQSCDAKQALACHNLANLYEQGLVDSTDAAIATALHSKACALGVKQSCQ